MSSSSTGSQDSPLSTTASVAGILTFVVAIAAAIYVRIAYLRNADQEYFQVKSSLAWFKTESEWMNDLVNATDRHKRRNVSEKEYQMCKFVMDQLVKLEARLLGLLVEAEMEANRRPGGSSRRWTLIPQRYRIFKFPTATATAVSWWPIRTKALELVRQRESLGPRALFAQLSMISSRLVEESSLREQEGRERARLSLLEIMIQSHREKLGRLELLISKVILKSSPNGVDPDLKSALEILTVGNNVTDSLALEQGHLSGRSRDESSIPQNSQEDYKYE